MVGPRVPGSLLGPRAPGGSARRGRPADRRPPPGHRPRGPCQSPRRAGEPEEARGPRGRRAEGPPDAAGAAEADGAARAAPSEVPARAAAPARTPRRVRLHRGGPCHPPRGEPGRPHRERLPDLVQVLHEPGPLGVGAVGDPLPDRVPGAGTERCALRGARPLGTVRPLAAGTVLPPAAAPGTVRPLAAGAVSGASARAARPCPLPSRAAARHVRHPPLGPFRPRIRRGACRQDAPGVRPSGRKRTEFRYRSRCGRSARRSSPRWTRCSVCA